ncbi:MAG: hypothetical protein KIG91_08315 [Treponema sp.]|nr:hypothetical protein [Treponema sp.]
MKRKIGVLAVLMVLISAMLVSCNFFEAGLAGTWKSDEVAGTRTCFTLKTNKSAVFYYEINGEKSEKVGGYDLSDDTKVKVTWEADDTYLTIKANIEVLGTTTEVPLMKGKYELKGTDLTFNGLHFSRL